MSRPKFNPNIQPPRQTTIHILATDYEYILSQKDFTGQPAYDILHKILYKVDKLTEEHQETQEFLQMAIEDKKVFRRENDDLRDQVKALQQEVSRLRNEVHGMLTYLSSFSVRVL